MSHNHGAASTTSTSSSHSMMIPYLHFTGGDFLFFQAWQPTSAGAIAGACIGLALLAIFERWLAATRSVFTAHWRRRAFERTATRDQILATQRFQDNGTPHTSVENVELLDKEKDVQQVPRGDATLPIQRPKSVLSKARTRTITPFIAAHDIPRGLLYGFQMLIMYLLMLAVMTFQASFFISIVLGLGIGEILFGRAVALGGSGH